MSPLRLNGLTLKNRILQAPVSLAELGPGGRLSRENILFYKMRAAGGCALVTVGESIVDTPTGKSHPMQIALDDPDSVPSLSACASAIHSHNAAASIELGHGGALCDPKFIGRNAEGPSSYIDAWGDQVDEMDEAEIKRLAVSFGEAAAMAKRCGFDMVTIHGGHGWLLHQFISPLTNKRTDSFGGSLENRMRFPLLAIEKAREAVGPSFPLEYRLSGSERVEGGYGIDTGIGVALLLDGKVDLIHVSAGTQADEHSVILMHPGVFQAEGENSTLARQIKKRVKTPVVAVGGFGTPELMESMLESQGADAIALGRALVADPFLPKKIFQGREKEIVPCLRCGECQSNMMSTRNMLCSVNPLAGREERQFWPLSVKSRKRILVIGGGPAGMQAAITASEKGHDVVLVEEKPVLGGMLVPASSEHFKGALRKYLKSQAEKLLSRSLDLRLGVTVDESLARSLSPDAIILAVGALPITPNIPGAGLPHVRQCVDLMGFAPPAETSVVIVGGGLAGCEQAIAFAQKGLKVTLLEMKNDLAEDCGRMHRISLLHELKVSGVKILTGTKCLEITEAYVRGTDITIPCGFVCLAVGLKPRSGFADGFYGLSQDLYIVGDAKKPRNALWAVREGYDAAADAGLFL
jgi:2,4-dienoyl-CoA reductase-like NADH-dependent reductase (Old Yellow Enzyme family)/thioredoxin reductase